MLVPSSSSSLRALVATAALFGCACMPALAGAPRARADQSRSLAYVLQNSNLIVYSLDRILGNLPATPVRTVTGFISPSSVAVDATGNVFVSDTLANTVYVFAPGHIQPSRRYNHGLNAPGAIAVGADGTLYVVNNTAGAPANVDVVEYAPGKHAPTRTLKGFPGSGPGVVALDGQNNLYVGCQSGIGTGDVLEFAPGATSGTDLHLQAAPAPSGLAIDASGDIVMSGYLAISLGQNDGRAVPAIAFYLAGQTTPTFNGSAPLYPGALAFTSDESAILVADSQDSVFAFEYGPSADFRPLGVLPAGPNTDVRGVAVSPRDPN